MKHQISFYVSILLFAEEKNCIGRWAPRPFEPVPVGISSHVANLFARGPSGRGKRANFSARVNLFMCVSFAFLIPIDRAPDTRLYAQLVRPLASGSGTRAMNTNIRGQSTKWLRNGRGCAHNI